MRKAFVLLSGGLDSTTCLYHADKHFDAVEGVSIWYGQRHRKEIEYAKESCATLGHRHHTIDLSTVIPRTMLTDKSVAIPAVSYDEIKGVSPTYVPYRNGLMLSALTSYAAGQHHEMYSKHPTGSPEDIPEWGLYFGAHAEDAANWAYPDCTPEFIGAMANAIHVGTYRAFRLHTPLQWLNKAGVIALGEDLQVPWQMTWSCYAGGEEHCGVCPTCRSRRAGFEAAGVDDPTVYADAGEF